MQSIYQAANAAEAHLIRQLLEREGIPAHVIGEYLQGVVGEVPAHTWVRVMVADEDVEHAQTLVAEWERGTIADPEALEALATQTEAEHATVPSASGDAASRRGVGSALGVFLFGAAVGAAICWVLLRGPTRAYEVDLDGDGKIDERLFYSGERLLRIETDRNRDLKPDVIARYDGNGVAERAEYDNDFDARFETRERYLRGELAETLIDDDGDGVVEYRAEYLLGVMFREEWRNAADAVVKRIEYARGIPRSGEIDRDGDGRIDHVRRYDARGEIVGETPIEAPADGTVRRMEQSVNRDAVIDNSR